MAEHTAKSKFEFTGTMLEPKTDVKKAVPARGIWAVTEAQAWAILAREARKKFGRTRVIFGEGVAVKPVAGPLARKEQPARVVTRSESAEPKPAAHVMRQNAPMQMGLSY